MKIGDLWIKLGLKKDEFSRGMQEAGNEVSGSGGLLSKLMKFKAGALAVWTAVGAAALKMADKFAHTSQRLGDAWDANVAGMKASWNTFVAAINSTDFSGIGKRIADSFREARQLASLKDAEFEVMNSVELQKSAMKDELAILQIRMRNQKLSQEERLAAQQEYLDKVRPLYEKEAQYRKQYSIQAQNAYLAGAGIRRQTGRDREALQTFLTDVASDAVAVQALEEFKRSGYRYANESQRTILEGLKAQTGVNLATLSKIADYYQSTSDEQAKTLVGAIVAERQAAGAFNEETRRVQSMQVEAVTAAGAGVAEEGLSSFEMAVIRANERIEELAEASIEDMERELLGEKIELDPIEVVPPDMTAWEDFYAKYKEDLQRMQDLLADFRDAAIRGLSDAVQELADQFAGLEEINPGKVVQTLLTPLADMAIKEGEILIAQGIGIEACKKALESLNGVAAIAAGTILVGIGAAAKSGLAALARSGAASAPTTSYASSGASSAAQTQTIQTEMTVYVTGRLSGSDILLSGQKTQSNWNR